jgi:hypothetical protein
MLKSGEPRDLARESAEKWAAKYLRTAEPRDAAREAAEKWAQYLDADKLGGARAAEIPLQRTRVAGHDRDCDFGL